MKSQLTDHQKTIWYKRASAVISTAEKMALQDERLQPLRDTILAWIDQKQIPSMAVGVVYQGKLIWLEALGMADIEQNIPATPQTIYPIGSMSKSVSSTGIMTLVEQGMLSLEESVNARIAPARLTSYQWDADTVTIWHILNSSAGIPHGWAGFNETGNYPKAEKEKDDFLLKYGIVTMPPGKSFYYSNYSFGVADLIMERVSGMPLERYLQQSLFQPLGMDHTYTTYLPDLDVPYAMTYHQDLSPYGHLTSIPYGGLGYYSSAEDLVKYAMFHLKIHPEQDIGVLSSENISLMHYFPKSTIKRFGLGWHDMGHALVSNGSVTGGNSHLSIIPEEKLAVICLTNKTSYQSHADQMAGRIIDTLLPDLEKQVTYETYVAEYETPYAFTPKLAGSWKGIVKAKGVDLAITLDFPEDGSVFLQIENGERQKLDNVVFNQAGFLNANFIARVPMPEYDGEEPVRHELALYLLDDHLVGHIAAAFSNERGSFRFGVFTMLERE